MVNPKKAVNLNVIPERITALYIRVSTDEQAKEGYSIETQTNKLQSYAEFKGWKNTVLFIDEGETARNTNRRAYQKLVAQIKTGQVATVVTLYLDRLHRNLLEMLTFIELCEEQNTAYVCADLNFDSSTPIGRMVLQILGAIAEFESNMKSVVVKTVMNEIINNKKKKLAKPAFGYQFDEDKSLVPIPEKAEWISRAADVFISGKGWRSTAVFLNNNGVLTDRGKLWSESTVRDLLTNEVYIGTLIWNRRYYSKDGKMKWNDESDWVVIENAHPAILSKEQWSAIQQRSKYRMPRGGMKQAKYRLSGLCKCGICGHTMLSSKQNKGSAKTFKKIFICGGYHKKGSCKRNYIFMDDLENDIYNQLEKIAEGYIDISDKDMDMANASRETDYKRREEQLEQAFDRQLQAYEKNLIDDRQLKKARDRLNREKEQLQQEKERIVQPQANEIKEYIKDQAKQILWLWNHGELPQLHNALRILFDSIIISENKISLKYNPNLFTPE